MTKAPDSDQPSLAPDSVQLGEPVQEWEVVRLDDGTDCLVLWSGDKVMFLARHNVVFRGGVFAPMVWYDTAPAPGEEQAPSGAD